MSPVGIHLKGKGTLKTPQETDPACSQGQVKGSRAGRQWQCGSGRDSPWQVVRKPQDRLEGL
jgi:hypothetical protein